MSAGKNIKKPLTLAVAATLIALAFPLSNLVGQNDTATLPLTIQSPDPDYLKVAPIFQQKCMDCHSSKTHFPFYTNFPIAKQLIEQDIQAGMAALNLTGKLDAGTRAYTSVDLAKLEDVVASNEMPPFRYLVMHWDAGLTPQNKADILAWIAYARQAEGSSGQPVAPIPDKVDLNMAMVALGERLYHDKQLSADGTIACASCHLLNKGGVDGRKSSMGIRGQIGPINAPTVYNSRYNFKQFWDGRADSLKDQAGGPINNPIEMGSDWPQVLEKLKEDHAYVASFKSLFPDGITPDNVETAIATFEDSLVTPNSRFDQYLKGKKDVLSSDEVQGYELFKKNGCATCHTGASFGGQSFEKMGVKRDYFADRGHLTEADNGRFNVTQDPNDRYKFKVPNLRNIDRTAPYFHDGSTSDLKEAVKVMAKYQAGKDLSDTDAEKMTGFLKTLTGEYKGKPVQ